MHDYTGITQKLDSILGNKTALKLEQLRKLIYNAYKFICIYTPLRKGLFMGQQVNVNIRIDSDIKKQADILFNEFGLNFTTAVNAFIRQSLRERAIPFQIRDISYPAEPTNEVLLSEGRDLIKSIREDSIRNGTDKMTIAEINALISKSRKERRAL